MDFYTFAIALLVVGLFAIMSADIILDMQSIWNQFERGSARIEYPEKPRPPRPKVALDWVQIVEDEQPVEEVDIIALAKSRMKSRPVIQAGAKVRELLDGLGKQLTNYSSMTIRQLKQLAKERRLKGYGSMRKSELIAALQS